MTVFRKIADGQHILKQAVTKEELKPLTEGINPGSLKEPLRVGIPRRSDDNIYGIPRRVSDFDQVLGKNIGTKNSKSKQSLLNTGAKNYYLKPSALLQRRTLPINIQV